MVPETWTIGPLLTVKADVPFVLAPGLCCSQQILVYGREVSAPSLATM